MTHSSDASVSQLFFVARTASGSAQVRASARHCHGPLRFSSVTSLPPSPAALLENLTIVFLFLNGLDGWSLSYRGGENLDYQ